MGDKENFFAIQVEGFNAHRIGSRIGFKDFNLVRAEKPLENIAKT